MELFNLFAKISLNKDEYDKGLEEGKKSAKDFSENFSKELKSASTLSDSSKTKIKNYYTEIAEKALDAMKDTQQAFDKGEISVEDFQDSMQKLEKQVNDSANALDELNGKSSKSTQSVSNFSQKLGSAFKTGVSVVAGFATAVAGAATAMAGLATQAMDYAGDLDDAATRVGMNTEAYQKWAFAMQLAGADASTLEVAVRNLTTFTTNLAAGNEDATAALQALGIGYEEFADMDVDEQLDTVVNALQNMEDQTEMTRLAQEIFGNRVYQQIMPLLTQEAGYVDELGESMKETGMIMSEDAVKAGAALGDELDTLKQRFTILSNTMLSELFPQIQLIIEGLSGLTTGSDDAMNALTEGLVGLINKVAEALPTILETGLDLLLNVISGLLEAIGNPDVINAIVSLLETLLFKVVELLPTLTQSLFNIAVALFDALLHLDWGTLIVELLIALIEIVTVQLPNLLLDAFLSVFDVFTSMFTEQGQEKFKRLGLDLAEALINGMISQAEMGLNLLIDMVNGLTGGLSKSWTWLGIPEIPKIPHVSFGRVDFAAGGMFDDVPSGTLYALAGESGAEIVAQGSRGTGVANIEQIADAQYMAMRDYDLAGVIQNAAAAIVNGIVAGLSGGGSAGNREPIIVRIGDRDFIGYIENALNSSLQSQGRKTLRSVTAYGTRR